MSISARYPLVEALTAAVFVSLALRFGWSWSLPAETVLMGGLVALAFIDYDHLLLPRVVVYPVGGAVAVLLVVAAAVQGSWHRLLVAAISALVEFAVLYGINRASPRALGFGDVRLGPVIALGLGWLGWRYALLGFLLANLIGAAVGVALLATRKAGRQTPVPFGVFLASGAFLAILLGSVVNYPHG